MNSDWNLSYVAGAELVAWGVFLMVTQILCFYNGKATYIELYIFPKLVFLIIDVFPPLIEQESSNFSPRISNLPFQYGAAAGQLILSIHENDGCGVKIG